MTPLSAAQSWAAEATRVLSTVSRSNVDRLMTFSTSRGRGLLLQRFAQFLSAHLHFLFQIGIGFLQPSGHVIELVGERLQFVAGLDRDALR